MALLQVDLFCGGVTFAPVFQFVNEVFRVVSQKEGSGGSKVAEEGVQKKAPFKGSERGFCMEAG